MTVDVAMWLRMVAGVCKSVLGKGTASALQQILMEVSVAYHLRRKMLTSGDAYVLQNIGHEKVLKGHPQQFHTTNSTFVFMTTI